MPDRPAAAFVRRRVPAAPRPAPPEGFAEKVQSLISSGRLQLLPYIDPYTEETAAMVRMYPVMMRHGVVKQALLTKVHSVTSLDLKTVPASGDRRDREVAEFVRYAYTTGLEGRFITLGEEILLPGLMVKLSVCEKVWYEELWQRGRWRGKQLLRCVKAKENVEPLYDEFRNVEQVKAWGWGNADRGPWPASDFIVFKNLPLYQGAGMSDLRAAYKHLWELDTVEKLHAIYLDLYGKPKVHATYSEAFDLTKDASGVDPRTALEGDLSNLGVRGWILTPDSVKLEALALATQSQADHLAFCKDRREQIAISIDAAFLHMMTAHQTRGEMRGDSQAQQTNKDLLVWALAEKLCAVLDSQLTPDLVNRNYYEADYPSLSLGGIDFAAMKAGMDVAERAQKMGFGLSKKALARDFNLQEAETPDDVLRAAPAAPAPVSGAALRFSDRQEFCGGPGSGRPGPCPSGQHGEDLSVDDVHGAYENAANFAVPNSQLNRAVDAVGGMSRPQLDDLSGRMGLTLPAAVPTDRVRHTLQTAIVDRRAAYLRSFRGGNPETLREEQRVMASGFNDEPLRRPDPPGRPGAPNPAPAQSAPRPARGQRQQAGMRELTSDKARAVVAAYEASASSQPQEFEAAVASLGGMGKDELLQAADHMDMTGVSGQSAPALRRTLEQRMRARRGATQRAGLIDRKLNLSDRQDFCGGLGSGVPGPCPTGQHDDDAGGPDGLAQSHAESMNNDPDSYRAADVDDANAELAREGGGHQIVADGQGGFEAVPHDEADAKFGGAGVTFDDPETGYPLTAAADYEGQLWDAYAEDPDALEGVASAMNGRIDRVSPEDLDAANEQLGERGGEYLLSVDGQGQVYVIGADDFDEAYPDGAEFQKGADGKLRADAK